MLDIEEIKKNYSFAIKEFLQGKDVVESGKCSRWARKKELADEKDLVYIRLQLTYLGSQKQTVGYHQFHLEDSEGYFIDATPPDDYLDKTLTHGVTVEGGLLFAVYQDVSPARLWFDTGLLFEDSGDPILLDILLPIPNSSTRTQFLEREQEEVARYTQMLPQASREHSQTSRHTEMLIKDMAETSRIPYKKVAGGYLLKVSLPESRKQNVMINFNGKDEQGADLVTIATICAPAQNQNNDRSFLSLNPKLPYGAIGISNIKGRDFYVITATYLAATVSNDLIYRAVQCIAHRGDWIEKHLMGGKDIR